MDPSFGHLGVVTTDRVSQNPEEARALALQPDGRIVVAGSIEVSGDALAVGRYNADGSIDKGFGHDGLATARFGDYGTANAVLVEPDGSIVAGGGEFFSDIGFALARFRPDGSLDTSFGNKGRVSTPIGAWAYVQGLVEQPDHKIIACGNALLGTQKVFALARYNTDGSLDSSFGSGGIVTTVIEDWSSPSALALQPDGKIVVAGSASDYPADDYTWQFALARYDSTGSLDASFGTGGVVTTSFGAGHGDYGHSVAVQKDGKIVIGGEDDDFNVAPDMTAFLLARFTSQGSLDSGFGQQGFVKTQLGIGSWVNALALQPDGKVIAGGVSGKSGGGGGAPTIARYQANGSLDTGFGSGGVALGEAPPRGGLALLALALQPDGRIVTAGDTFLGRYESEAFLLERFLGDASYLLQVQKRHGGKSRVLSRPDAISCGSRCQAWFAPAATVELVAKPAHGWGVQWRGACTGQRGRSCEVRMDKDTAAVAAFVRCHVPKLRGLRLARARHLIRRSRCALGRVSQRHSGRVTDGRVISQRPRAYTTRPVGTKVKLVVSEGKRR